MPTSLLKAALISRSNGSSCRTAQSRAGDGAPLCSCAIRVPDSDSDRKSDKHARRKEEKAHGNAFCFISAGINPAPIRIRGGFCGSKGRKTVVARTSSYRERSWWHRIRSRQSGPC